MLNVQSATDSKQLITAHDRRANFPFVDGAAGNGYTEIRQETAHGGEAQSVFFADGGKPGTDNVVFSFFSRIIPCLARVDMNDFAVFHAGALPFFFAWLILDYAGAECQLNICHTMR